MSENETREAYRKRAETAPLILNEQEPRTVITETVYWPGDGYGAAQRCADMEDAQRRARETLALGYGQAKDNTVHIIVTTTRVIEVSIERLPHE